MFSRLACCNGGDGNIVVSDDDDSSSGDDYGRGGRRRRSREGDATAAVVRWPWEPVAGGDDGDGGGDGHAEFLIQTAGSIRVLPSGVKRPAHKKSDSVAYIRSRSSTTTRKGVVVKGSGEDDGGQEKVEEEGGGEIGRGASSALAQTLEGMRTSLVSCSKVFCW